MVLFDDADPSFVYVASTVYGHFVSHDGGTTFGWICNDLFAEGSVDSFPIDGAVLAGGASRAVIVAGSDGLFRSDDDGCSWDRVEALADRRTSAIAIDPRDPARVWVTTADGGEDADNALYQSRDGGVSFAPTSLAGPRLFRSVMPDQNGELWATSFFPEDDRSYLHRSVDDGETWTAEALPDLGARVYRIVGAIDDVPGRVLLRAGTATDDVLVLAHERGGIAEVVLEPGAPLYETRIAGDGAIVIGDGAGNTWHSTNGGVDWDLRAEAPAQQCYAERADTLYACTRQVEERAAVLASIDDGASWDPFFRYEATTGPLSCLGAEEEMVCTGGDRFLTQCFEFDEFGVAIEEIAACPELPVFGDDDSSSGAGESDTSGDAPAADDAPGCACTHHPRDGARWWLLAALVAVPRRRGR